MARRRSWAAARAKVEAEAACRRCGSSQLLDACHVIPRSRVGPPEGEEPLNIIVLCRLCHQESHNGTGLDLLPYMTLEEQGNAARLVGITEAYQRITNTRLAA